VREPATREGEEEARDVLRTLQELVDARDLDGLLELFDENSVLIGSSGDGRDRPGVRRYLEGVAGQPGELRWEWAEVIPFHRAKDIVGFAAFGDVVVVENGSEWRQPIRMTGLAVRVGERWRLRQFHGSIPFVG
jgi:SnoaL-like protein